MNFWETQFKPWALSSPPATCLSAAGLLPQLSQFSSVQSLCYVRLFANPWTAAYQASLVHHQLPELAQTHVHRVDVAIQPSHPLSSPSPPTFNHSQHQGLFKWVSSSHQVAEVISQRLSFRAVFLFPQDLMQDPALYSVHFSLVFFCQNYSSGFIFHNFDIFKEYTSVTV